jgi:hypothetical protein
MSNTKVGMMIGSGVVTGIATVAIVRAAQTRRRNRSLLGRTRYQAMVLGRQAAKLRESMEDLIDSGRSEVNRRKKHIVKAIEAGRAAYSRVAR